VRAPELIRKKRDGEVLSPDEIRFFLDGFTAGTIADYQMAAMAMAIYFQGLSDDELAVWTDAMLHSGEVLDLSDAPGPRVDKHSTGGVGDKTSFILAPIAAAAGLCVPMVSGRGLGHTGGTLDKLEAIPGLTVSLDLDRFKRLVYDNGCAIIGQTGEIAPADKRLYALRDVTATVRCIPLIASSIMSKKLAEGLSGLILDVKVGSGAFMRSEAAARELSRKMVGIGQRMGVHTRVILSSMEQPLGQTVGNAIELVEAIEVLRGGGPADLVELSCTLAGEMMVAGGLVPTLAAGLARAAAMIASGAALERFARMVAAQGGDVRCVEDPSRLPRAPVEAHLFVDRPAFVAGFDCEAVGMVGMRLGAGRARADDAIDHGVGLRLHARWGDAVEPGTPVATVYARTAEAAETAVKGLRAAITLSAERCPPPPLILGEL